MIQALGFALVFLLQGLAPLGTVSGKVLSPAGAPVGNVRVSVLPMAGDSAAINRSALTDNSGHYSIIGIPSGRYYVTAGPPSDPSYLPGTSTRDNAEVLTVTTGSVKNNADFKNYAGRTAFSIKGRFAPPPTPGTSLVLNSGAQRVPASIDSNGFFEFSGVPTGTANLSITLPSGRAASLGNIRLEDDIAVVVLGGRVAIEDGSALPSIEGVSAGYALGVESYVPSPGRSNPVVRAQSTLQPDGSFALLLPEGEHRIRLRNVPFEYTTRSITSGAVDLANAPLSVSLSANLSEIRATMGMVAVAGAKVSGRISGLPAQIVSTAVIHLVPGDGSNKSAATVAKSDGTFEFPQVPPGLYSLFVLEIRTQGPQTAVIAQRIWNLQVRAEDLYGIDFPGFVVQGFLDGGLGIGRLDTLPKVSGRVTVIDENGAAQPVPSGLLMRLTGSIPSLTSVTADGTFTMLGNQGDHRIAFSGVPAGYSIKSMTSGDVDLINSDLHLETTSPPPQEVRITLELNRRDAAEGRSRIANGSISGRLVDRNGTPAANIPVHAATAVIAPSSVSSVTDNAGNFRMENLPPGQYIIFVGPNDTGINTSRIVMPRGQQVLASDPPLQISIGYGTTIDIGTAVRAVDLQSPAQGRTFSLYRLQTN